jgi:NTP pyrophosphatase (non-canonical NTP hydrolase)
MDFNEYQAAALRTAKPEEDTFVGNLVHASLGLATESGEFTTEVKRIARYGKSMTEEMRQHMMEELGDTLWYIALAAKALDTTIEQMARDNIAKLQLCLPDKFSNEAAEARADKAGQTVERERTLFNPQ